MTAIAPILTPAELLQALRVDPPDEARPAIRDDELRSRSVRAPRWPLVALSAAAGVAFSLLLVPTGGEGADPSRVPVLTRLEAAVASGDRSPEAIIALARERQRAGQDASALALLQDLVTHEPRRASAWQALADMLYDQGRRDEALAALERAQRLAPTPERGQLITARRDLARMPVAASAAPAQPAPELVAAVRPEKLLVDTPLDEPGLSLPATLRQSMFAGRELLLTVELPGHGMLDVLSTPSQALMQRKPGDGVTVGLRHRDLQFFAPGETGVRLVAGVAQAGAGERGNPARGPGMRDVVLHGLEAEHQAIGDQLVAEPLGHQLQDLALALG